jgi:hypothetical protein
MKGSGRPRNLINSWNLPVAIKGLLAKFHFIFTFDFGWQHKPANVEEASHFLLILTNY